MKVIGKNIAIKVINEEVTTSSGISLSEAEMKEFRYAKGEVVMPGSDVTVIDKGDVIYYDTRQSYLLMINGEQTTIIQERDVVVVL